MPRRLAVVPLVIAVHVPLTRRRIVPPSPAANTSVALAAHTAWSSVLLALAGGSSVHHVPVDPVLHVVTAATHSDSAGSPSCSVVTQPRRSTRQRYFIPLL